MNLYELVVFIHVAAAVALLSGSVVGSPAVRAAVRRGRTTQEVRAYLAIGRPLQVLEPLSAFIVLASGIYLTSVANFWSLGWVQVAAVLWLVNSALAPVMVKPALKAVTAQATADPDGPVGRHLDMFRWSRQWSIGGDLLMANDAAVLCLMTVRPELIGSLLVVAGAALLVSAVRLIGLGQHPAPGTQHPAPGTQHPAPGTQHPAPPSVPGRSAAQRIDIH